MLTRFALPLVPLLLLTGCGKSAEEADVRVAVTAFFTATTTHRNDVACADLAPQTAEGLQTSASTCSDQIGELGLSGGAVRAVRVWGDRAQVVLTSDTVFLTRTSKGWKVTAAGCERQAKGPYDCDVEA